MNVHAARSAGWSALTFVVLVIAITILQGPMPSATAKPADLALYVDVHRAGLLWAAWLTFPASAFFLWFIVGLREYLRQAPGRQEGLATFALIAGIVITAIAFIGAFLESAIAYAPPDLFQSNGFAALYAALVFSLYGLSFAPIAIFLFAAAHSMRRHASAPAWLAWLGYFAALCTAVATFSIFSTSPLLGPTGLASLAIGAIPATIWVVATGVVLIRTRETAVPGR